MDGDIALPGGLYQAGKGRALAENTRLSRSRNDRIRRTLDWAELGDWIDRLCQVDGAQRLAAYREQAERVADAVGAPAEGIKKLSQMIGAALGTQQVHNASKALTARQASLPYDQERIRRLDRLVTALRESAPQNRPEVPNRAGDSAFVLPGLVAGTLAAGWRRLSDLDTAFERAVYMMFLVSEVHPFDDGNGRLARAMMNAELVAGMQSRIIVPTVFRDDYLGGLRRMTRQDDPSVLIKALRYAHDYTAQIDFSDLTRATETLRATNAFHEPDSDYRLTPPTSLSP